MGVRMAAAQALGDIRDIRAVEPLLAALHDAEPEVRMAAAQALGDIGEEWR
jgi:HEAT repeat protein